MRPIASGTIYTAFIRNGWNADVELPYLGKAGSRLFEAARYAPRIWRPCEVLIRTRP